MREISSLRTYNQKVFALSHGKRRFQIHSGHIHYKNAQGHFCNSNFEIKKQPDASWIMDQHNYHLAFPKYADGVFDFFNAFEGANHHIKIKPLANHIEGIKQGSSIFYKAAFGEGLDYRVQIQRSGVRKMCVINKDPGKDLVFDFELILDSKTRYLKQGLSGNAKLKTLTTPTDLTGQAFRFGEAEKQSYVKQAIVWDSVSKHAYVGLSLYEKEGKLYLRKTITKEFFAGAVFPVFTDHPTNYYGSTADGWIYKSDTQFGAPPWVAVRGAATGTSASDTDASYANALQALCSDIGGGNYGVGIRRSFFYFDTSGIGGDTINSCSLKVYGVTNNDSDVSAQKGTQSDILVVADYDALEGSEYGHVSWAVGQYNEISFNAQGKTDINKTGTTKICCREYTHDYSNSCPSVNNNHENGCYFAEQSGEDKDPYLDISTTPSVLDYPVAWLKKGLVSGFHSFLNAYVKAKIGSYNPLKLPDGTIF